jgi:hypothetical protein
MTLKNKTSSILIAIVAILLITGSFYYSTLQNKAINETPTTTADKNTETDTRILLTAENNIDHHSKDEDPCNQLFNQDQPNTTVKYSNTQYGLSFDVPFNSDWGNTNYKIEPYWQQEDKVEFGAIEGTEGCGWMRGYALSIKKQQNAEELTKQITDELGQFGLVTPPTTAGATTPRAP